MRNLLSVLFFSCLIICNVFAKEKTYGNLEIDKIDIVKIQDGDTIKINIPNVPKIFGDNIEIRLNGVDTPELHSKSGYLKQKALIAREFVKYKIFMANKIELRNMKRDKFFRIDADIYLDNINLTTLLINYKLGYEYNGGAKKTEQEQEDYLK